MPTCVGARKWGGGREGGGEGVVGCGDVCYFFIHPPPPPPPRPPPPPAHRCPCVPLSRGPFAHAKKCVDVVGGMLWSCRFASASAKPGSFLTYKFEENNPHSKNAIALFNHRDRRVRVLPRPSPFPLTRHC